MRLIKLNNADYGWNGRQTNSLDNAPAVVASIENLKTNEGLVEMTHKRCGTHVLNLIVQNGLKNLGESSNRTYF